jgi:O-antigen/teichoic acid export membrane protein
MKISNYVLSLSEYIFETLIVFILFRIVITTLGLEYLGVWSLAMSLTALTAVGSAGFASSAVKFVSQNYSRDYYDKTKQIITTTFYTVLLISCLMTALAYTAFFFGGHLYLKPFEYSLLDQIILVIFSSFILGSSGRVLLSSLDGMLEISKRSITGMISKTFYFAFSLVLLKQFGLLGLSIGLIVKETVSLFLSFYFVTRKLNYNVLATRYISRAVFCEIFNYGYKFQLNSVIGMVTDPVTKFLIKDFGGLHMLGLFEIIYKFFWQARMLIVVMMNTYLPVLAGKSDDLNSQFSRFFNFTFSFSILPLMLVFSFTPFIVYFLKIENTAIIYFISFILLCSLFINLLGTAAYIHNLAKGKLNHILISTIIFAVVNTLFGYAAGKYFTFYGFLFSWMLAHIISTFYLIYSFQKNENIPFYEIFDWSYVRIFVVILAALEMASFFSYYSFLLLNPILISVINLLLFVSIGTILFLKEPKFKYPILFILRKVPWPHFVSKII